jgi:heat shock protein HtpX
MAISRQREYVADATGAQLLGDPNPLADALETLQRGAEAIPMNVNPSAAPLFIVNPLAANARGRGGRGMGQLFSTHPPMEERIARLRRMAGASSLQLQTF